MRTGRWYGVTISGAISLLVGVSGAIAPAASGLSTVPTPETSVTTPEPEVTAVPGERGNWQVEQLAPNKWQVTWESPTRLPITSDRPLIVPLNPALSPDASISTPTLDESGRTLTALIESPTAPEPADLSVTLSGRQLDVVDPPEVPVAAAAIPQDLRQLATDPATPGPYTVASSDYDLAPVKLPGMPEPIEMVGHVVEPAANADTGPRPLVLFLHGRHEFCYGNGDSYDWPCQAPRKEIPGHLGYDYMQRVLASQGFATVSVRVNGINAQDWNLDDGGAGARAAIVINHLKHWATIADDHQVDLSRTVLVGHSRGGEGVNRAALRIPLSAPYRVVGQVLLAPTDFATQPAAPYIPTVTMLPYCDGDVSDLQGQKFTDAGRDLLADDTALKSSVMVMGANHNFFNTEWTPGISAAPSFDDWWGPKNAACGTATAARLTAAEQRKVGTAYVAGAARLFATGAEQFLPLYDGSSATIASIGDADVRTHAIGGGRELRKPALGATLTTPTGTTQLCQGLTAPGARACGRGIDDWGATPHWLADGEVAPSRRFFEFAWTGAGQTGGLRFSTPLDLTDRRLEARTIVDPGLGNVRLQVKLTDSAGASAVLTPANNGALPALLKGEGLAKRWAQTLIVDPATAVGLDLTAITSVELVGQSPDGRVWLADLASASTDLASVPDRRTPVISLGTVRQVEGDGPGEAIAQVPYRIAGSVAEPSKFLVAVVDQENFGPPEMRVIDVAPGTKTGVLDLPYEADQVDDYPELTTMLAAWGTQGVTTDDYLGKLTLLDDDPTPKITVKRVKASVREGNKAKWRITLAAPVDYEVYVDAQAVAGPRPMLRGTDVPKAWLKSHGNPNRPNRPLHKLGVWFFGVIEQGQRTATLTIPIRRDGLAERREHVTLQINVNDQTYTQTITVKASR